ncbi:uncharacterized protein TNCV_4239881 [Trichonephila clavipes]|nr:uncharacterized protein TNCV_4239881 [Trichonephila clavipes]
MRVPTYAATHTEDSIPIPSVSLRSPIAINCLLTLRSEELLTMYLVILNNGQVMKTISNLSLILPNLHTTSLDKLSSVAAVAEWYRYRIMASFVMSSNPVPLKTHRVGQRRSLNLSRPETSSHWCGVAVRRGESSGVVHVT